MKRLWMKEWLKKRDDHKLSDPNDSLNLLRMDEGIHEEFLNLFGPKFQKQDTQTCLSESMSIHNIVEKK